MERASEAVIYLPVQRQNMHGGQMSPDLVAAIPVPLWEELVEKFDAFDTGWQGDDEWVPDWDDGIWDQLC